MLINHRRELGNKGTLNTREAHGLPKTDKTSLVSRKTPLKQEELKTNDIITIGSAPMAETIIPFKKSYAGLQEKPLKKHLETYRLQDSKTGDNYTLKANGNGAVVMFIEEPDNSNAGRQNLSVNLESNRHSSNPLQDQQSLRSLDHQSLLSAQPTEFYFFSR
jgi:hypothetical protein